MTDLSEKGANAVISSSVISFSNRTQESDSLEFDVAISGNESNEERSVKYEKKSINIKHKIIIVSKYLTHVVAGAYFGCATYHFIDIENSACYITEPPALCGIQFCNGYGLLVLLSAFTYFGLFYYFVFKPKVGKRIFRLYLKPFNNWWMHISRSKLVSALMGILLLACFSVLVYFEARDEPRKLISLTGPCIFIIIGYTFSKSRKAIKWRTVITGITCQFILGIICIRWEVGRQIFQCLGDKVATFLGYTNAGTRFVFGDKIIDDGVFAFAILPVIFFFSFFISILYYLGIMQWIVMKLGWILQQILDTTVCESVISAANIFLGMSESPLLIKPYINVLTASEIHSIMVSGFATVSGTTLAAYVSFGASPAHLITSSVMAAPATLALSKLFLPETEESKTTSENIILQKSEDCSVLDAAANGASHAITIVLGIIANIVAFVAFIAFLNAVVNWLGFLVGFNEDFDFEWIFSKIFIPFVWVMGVPSEDCDIVAKVVATKTIINEFIAYERLGEYTKTNQIGARSAGIATYAICGFGNPSSLGILIGTLCSLAPNKRSIITSVALRAVLVGTLVCFMSASFAGILLPKEE